MVLKVDLQCSRCYKKVKKVLCKFHEITDQKYDEKADTVTISVVSWNPESIKNKISCKAGRCVKGIEIKPPEKKPETPDGDKKTEKKEKEPEEKKVAVIFFCNECNIWHPEGTCEQSKCIPFPLACSDQNCGKRVCCGGCGGGGCKSCSGQGWIIWYCISCNYSSKKLCKGCNSSSCSGCKGTGSSSCSGYSSWYCKGCGSSSCNGRCLGGGYSNWACKGCGSSSCGGCNGSWSWSWSGYSNWYCKGCGSSSCNGRCHGGGNNNRACKGCGSSSCGGCSEWSCSGYSSWYCKGCGSSSCRGCSGCSCGRCRSCSVSRCFWEQENQTKCSIM